MRSVAVGWGVVFLIGVAIASDGITDIANPSKSSSASSSVSISPSSPPSSSPSLSLTSAVEFGKTFRSTSKPSSSPPTTPSVLHRTNVRKTQTASDLSVPGVVLRIRNPGETVSVVAPSDSCENAKTVSYTAAEHGCTAAVNAGFFHRSNGSCAGNVVYNGNVLHRTRDVVKVTAFVVKRDGTVSIGYYRNSIVDDPAVKHVVSGYPWIVRDGKDAVDESIEIETPPHLDQGKQEFVDIRAPRVAIGFNAEGEVIVAKTDGIEAERTGLNLHELAEVMIKHGAVQAVNLDGGGSASLVIDGALVGAPQDACGDDTYCERNVTSVICIQSDPSAQERKMCVSLPSWKSLNLAEEGWKASAITSATIAFLLLLTVLAVRHYYQRKASKAMYDYVFDDTSEMLDVVDDFDDQGF